MIVNFIVNCFAFTIQYVKNRWKYSQWFLVVNIIWSDKQLKGEFLVVLKRRLRHLEIVLFFMLNIFFLFPIFSIYHCRFFLSNFVLNKKKLSNHHASPSNTHIIGKYFSTSKAHGIGGEIWYFTVYSMYYYIFIT